MNWSYEVATLLMFVTLALSRPQQDASTAFDECRTVTASDLADKKAPTFATYHVAVPEILDKPKLDLKSSPTARRYRTLLWQEISQGPNFAGYYRVAIWGCGSSCAMFAVVNLKTGRVIAPEGFYATTAPLLFDVDGQKVFPESQSEEALFGFRKDSRLLVVLGDLDDGKDREGAFYFVLDGERLRLIHSTVVKKDCEKLREKSK